MPTCRVPPTGKTDAIEMQHDVDYAVCGDKNDRKINLG